MQLTVDISFYPLKDEFITPIKWFIERLANYPTIQRRTNSMSTQVMGPYEDVMKMLTIEMKASYEAFGKGVFVCKFLSGERELNYPDKFNQGFTTP